jgi:hypothetical protein
MLGLFKANPLLNPDFRDILSAFLDAKVEFLLVGAYAVAAYGHPRATGDLDLCVRATTANATKVHQALQQFGAPLEGISVAELAEPNLVFQIGIAPRRIDILTSISGVDFDEAYAEKSLIQVDGLFVPTISKALLIKNKRATGRTQDLADAEKLEGIT